ncbi:ligand-binding sensor domain-containing protein [Dyadobacter aurulentus]|uniref:hypothetical protein n=1 Tax=Dyadobacter sp. UC 10 TaxID=2605428 RepID=UPI0011F30C86|nr:hypothetical protein [Dyadobacter sp. UC 10]KAA0991822.1 hypothetical protein FXO21_17425 [Dyadobacter sp. UC 10]
MLINQTLLRLNKWHWLLLLSLVMGLSPQRVTAQDGPFCDAFRTFGNGGMMGQTIYSLYTQDQTVYAGTNDGLYISPEGRNNFVAMIPGYGGFNANGLYAVGQTIYAGTQDGFGLYISTDGGSNFTYRTTASGLGHEYVSAVYVVGSTVYAATAGGLSISTDGGNSFTNRTTANGLGDDGVNAVYVMGSTVYAATAGGLSISTNGGNSFTNRTTANGLGDDYVNAVYVMGSTVYAATANGLSISTDGGNSFTNRTTANELGDDYVNAVYVMGSTVYAATANGLSISTDGGNSFTNMTTANGLRNNYVYDVNVMGQMIYVATAGGLSVCSADPLPVSLISFTAKAQPNRKVILNWSTAIESDNGGFLIERSKDLRAFEKVGQVGELSANSSTRKDYQLIDQLPYQGTSYYRLTQTDLSGKKTVYPAISVVIRDEPYGVYPNPVVGGDEFTLRLDEPETAKVGFYHVDGGSFPLQKKGVQGGNLLLKTRAQLPAGVYIITVEERGLLREHRLVVE